MPEVAPMIMMVFLFLRPFSSKRFLIERIFISFCLAKLQNVAQKALGKGRKSGAEGESLKLLSESGAIIAEFDVVEIRHDLAARLRCSTNGTQESSSKLDFALAALSFLFHKSVEK